MRKTVSQQKQKMLSKIQGVKFLGKDTVINLIECFGEICECSDSLFSYFHPSDDAVPESD